MTYSVWKCRQDLIEDITVGGTEIAVIHWFIGFFPGDLDGELFRL